MPRPIPFFVFTVWAAVGLVVVPLGLKVPFGGWSDFLFLLFASSVLLSDEIALLGAKKAIFRFVAIAVVAGAAEWLGVTTGVLFGHYVYTAAWGPLLASTLPLSVPLAWYCLVLPLQRVVLGDLRPVVSVPLGAALLVVCDLVLDPVATLLRGYWTWPAGGPYYGVPLSNFVGWFITGLLVMGIATATAKGRMKGTRMRARALSVLGWTVGLFGLAAAVGGLWIPAVLGLPFLILAGVFFRPAWRSKNP
ncbi:MAG: carotenoid biosynthesis protein [Puniceicoccaceae bacterium]